MIDVIFLLLTFFIYNLLISTPMRVMPIQFADAATGNREGIERLYVLRVDRSSVIHLGNDRVELSDLDAKLREIASHPSQPMLHILFEDEGDKDRVPLLWHLVERVKRAGIRNMTFVGRPGPNGTGGAGVTDGTN